MKRLTLALLVVLVASLAAFHLQAGADAPASVGTSTDVSGADAVPPTSAPRAPQTPPTMEATTRSMVVSELSEASEASTADGQADQGRAADERESFSRPAEVSRSDDGDRRRSRRWRRNRYPGPIPTPDEWVPPEGRVRIGLQVGHWRTEEAPPELSGLRGNGTRWGDMHEWQANLEIARRTGEMLEELGYEVDLLPAVVPPGYRAHLFIAIHADGSNDPGATGFRVASPRRDATGRASGAVELLERTYGESTGLPRIPTVTRRMRSYYAFNFRRYEHALHPMTIAVIIETGYLTSPGDRRIIVDAPERAAQGIVEAVKAFPHTPPPEIVDRQ